MASLHYKYATMNSGKTTQLIQAHFNYVERGMRPLAFLPAIDTRAGVGVIHARVGLSLENVPTIKAEDDIFALVKKELDEHGVDVVLIDEAQFLTKEHVYQLACIVDKLNIPVVAYGLKSDFQANLFPGSYHLLVLADKTEELKSICWCGKKGHMVARVDDKMNILREGPQVEIGGNDRYISLCRKHFLNGATHKEHWLSPITSIR